MDVINDYAVCCGLTKPKTNSNYKHTHTKRMTQNPSDRQMPRSNLTYYTPQTCNRTPKFCSINKTNNIKPSFFKLWLIGFIDFLILTLPCSTFIFYGNGWQQFIEKDGYSVWSRLCHMLCVTSRVVKKMVIDRLHGAHTSHFGWHTFLFLCSLNIHYIFGWHPNTNYPITKMRIVHRTKFMPMCLWIRIDGATKLEHMMKVKEEEKKFCSSSNFTFLIQKVTRFLSATFCENLFQTWNNQMFDYKSQKVLFPMVLNLKP